MPEKINAALLDPIDALKQIRSLTEYASKTEDAEKLLQYLDMIKTVVDKVLPLNRIDGRPGA